MNSPKSTSQRTWTAVDEPRKNKWLPIVLLFGLLCGGLYLFVTNVLWQSKPRVYFASISVARYGGMLPSPAYPNWEIGVQNGDSLTWAGLVPWSVIEQATPSSTDEIDQVFASLDEELQAAKVSNRDTLIVYLRCQCLVFDDELYLLPGEFDQDSVLSAIANSADKSSGESAGESGDLAASPSTSPPRGAILMADKLRQLQSLSAENVVVLADICDLTTAPQLGVLANDITQHIQDAVGALPTDQALWVIAAAANLQPTHVSYVRQQTLLQSAAEYALNPGLVGDGNYLSLAAFYEAVLRYGHDVSSGSQTPVLFHCGTASVLNASGRDWATAQRVLLANVQADADTPNDDSSEASGDSNAVAVRLGSERPALRRVSLNFNAPQDATATQQDDSGSADPLDAPEGELGQAGAKLGTQIDESTLTPELRFWSIRERLLDRNVGSAGWSPVDFAVDELQQADLEMLYLTRLERIRDWRFANATGNAAQEISRIVEELKNLESALGGNRSVQQTAVASDQKLLSAWNQFIPKLAQESGRAAWAEPSVLPREQQQRWEPIRQSYRSYLDVANRLAGWVDASLQDFRHAADTRQLSSALQTVVQRLGGASQPPAVMTAFDHPLGAADLQTARSADENLRRLLTERVADLERRVRNAQAESQVHWSDERELQQLLQNRNLEFSHRRRLEELYRSLTTKDFASPGTGNRDVDLRLAIDVLLASSGDVSARAHYADWAALVSETNRLTGRVIGRPASSQASGLNTWARDLLPTTQAANQQPASAVEQWNRACLASLMLFPKGEGRASLIVPISQDTTLDATVPKSVRIPQTLICEVKRRNGSTVRECFVRWRLVNANSFQLSSGKLLQVRSSLGRQLEPDVATRIEVAGGEVRLELQTELEFSPRAQPLQMQIAVSERVEDLASDATLWQAVSVTPPNPDRVRLFAKAILPLGTQPEATVSNVLWSTEDDGVPILRTLSVPAVAEAKAEYELLLANLSDQDKWIRASIYSVRSAAAVGDGQVSGPAMQATRRELRSMQPHFTTAASVLLPANASDANSSAAAVIGSGLPTNARPLQLVPAVGPGAAAASPVAGSIGEFGLVCVVEEMSGGGADAVPLDRESSLHWINCGGDNPAIVLVDITPKATAAGYELDIAVKPDVWNRFGLAELELSAFVTDDWGQRVGFRGIHTALLTPDMPRDLLRLQPERDTGRPLVVHVDIGGYPRATNFQSRLRDEIPRGATQSFVWLDGAGLVCTTADGTQIPTQQIDDKVIIPSRENVDGISDGVEVQVASLSVLCQIDFPRIGRPSEAQISFLAPTRYIADRRFQPRLETKSGHLVLSASMNDLLYEVDLRRQSLSGLQTFSAMVKNEPSTGKSIQVVFDREPPNARQIELSSSDLYAEEELLLEIDANDESGIRMVVFAVDLQNGEHIYDADDALFMPARRVGDRWEAVLKASALESADLRAGSYFVVSRTIDNAGNFQDENEAERFRWMAEKRPVAKPPPPKKTTVNKPPPPAEPTEFTVLVSITVEGVKPDYPERTSISGVEGANKQNRGGNWVVLKVPAGSYNVEAKYSDAFGVEYSGSGGLRVGPGLANRVKINATK